jgi:hypothetical protein
MALGQRRGRALTDGWHCLTAGVRLPTGSDGRIYATSGQLGDHLTI